VRSQNKLRIDPKKYKNTFTYIYIYIYYIGETLYVDRTTEA